MGFELVIAAKQDPVETAAALHRDRATPAAPSLSVATINVSGAFDDASASELVQRIQDELRKPADTVIVCFEEMVSEDPQSLVTFAHWIEALRHDGHDVRVAAGSPQIRALLEEKAISPDAVVQPADADAIARRRVLDTYR